MKNIQNVDCFQNYIHKDHKHFVIIHVNLRFHKENLQLQEDILMEME
jgi:hypothetical protein